MSAITSPPTPTPTSTPSSPINMDHKSDDSNLIHISSNFFNPKIFVRGIVERKQGLEQYFWTDNTVERLMIALANEPDCCCLTTPTLAHAWHMIGRDESLLDIDKRFAYLPRYTYFDLTTYPTYPTLNDTYRILIFDPPFFYIDMATMFRAVTYIVGGNYKTKLMIGFLKREENILMQYFGCFGIKPTNFALEYTTVKPNKWRNYCLYSNVDLPGIKRIHTNCKNSK